MGKNLGRGSARGGHFSCTEDTAGFESPALHQLFTEGCQPILVRTGYADVKPPPSFRKYSDVSQGASEQTLCRRLFNKALSRIWIIGGEAEPICL